MVNPHVLPPQGVRRHTDCGKCEKDAAIDYVNCLAFAVMRGTIEDAIYRGEECENIHSCIRVSYVRFDSFSFCKELIYQKRFQKA